jgi:hypothetical protein
VGLRPTFSQYRRPAEAELWVSQYNVKSSRTWCGYQKLDSGSKRKTLPVQFTIRSPLARHHTPLQLDASNILRQEY